MSNYSCEDYEKDPFLATTTLGDFLAISALTLFIGAGASTGFGLPSWKLLLARLLDKGTDKAFLDELEGKNPTDQRKLIDELDDASDAYRARVHDALYGDVAKDLLTQLQRSPLLLALAALFTGSHRGRVSVVMTYNYDDLLEQYLRMLGLAVCRRFSPDQLSTRADVELNYVHGRLPQVQDNTSSTLILSEKSYRTRLADIDSGWAATVVHNLHAKIGLFIGLSGDDASILINLKRAQLKVKRNQDYAGYWLLTPDAFLRNKADILDVGMCPIRIDAEKIPSFLFRMCQQAAL